MKELEKENSRLKKLVAKLSLDNMIQKDIIMNHVETHFALSQRKACRLVYYGSSALRYIRKSNDDEVIM